MSDTLTLPVDAGATFNAFSFKYLEADEVTPVPLTSLKIQVRLTPTSPLKFEVTPTWNSVTGLIEFEFSAAQTSTLTEPEYVWALEGVLATTETVRIIGGRVSVTPEVVY